VTVLISEKGGTLKESVRKIFECFDKNIDYKRGFFLKPNIVFPVNEKSGEITRPKVVRAVIEVLRERAGEAEIVIGEGTAAGTIPLENFRVSGFLNLSKQAHVPLLDLNEVERIGIKWKYGRIDLPGIIFERNYINLPILKMSSAAVISGAMKNQKGLLSVGMKKKFHKMGLHDPIAELARVVQPTLTIMDAFNVFKKDVLMAGDNLYEIDKTAIDLLGMNEPEYLSLARQYGLGSDKYRVLKGDVPKIRIRKKETDKYKKWLRMRLWSNPRACSMCRLNLINLKRIRLKNLDHAFSTYLKLLKHSIKGAEFVFGSDPKFSPTYEKVICIGNCTKKLAQEKGYAHIPGCPPSEEEMVKYL
jgi:uncharacterized protein (DUF362 family)